MALEPEPVPAAEGSVAATATESVFFTLSKASIDDSLGVKLRSNDAQVGAQVVDLTPGSIVAASGLATSTLTVIGSQTPGLAGATCRPL